MKLHLLLHYSKVFRRPIRTNTLLNSFDITDVVFNKGVDVTRHLFILDSKSSFEDLKIPRKNKHRETNDTGGPKFGNKLLTIIMKRPHTEKPKVRGVPMDGEGRVKNNRMIT